MEQTAPIKLLEYRKEDYLLTTDTSRMDVHAIHDFLSNHSYWSKNIPFEKVKTSVQNSLNFGIFKEQKQIGYARVISDYSTIAYLGDVYILQPFREQGLSKWLVETIMNHPDLQGLRRWILLTSNAHELYQKYGWTLLRKPEVWMEKHNPDVYLNL